MKKWILTSLIGLIACPSVAFAQMDPGAITAAGSSGSSWSGDDTTGRYVHKPKKQKRAIASETPSPSPTPNNANTEASPGTRINAKDVNPSTAPSPAPSPTPIPVSSDSIPSKVRDFVLGGDEADLQNYKGFLDNQDIRKNIFEVSLSTGYMYNASSSSYYFKNYNDSGPTIDLNADIWLSPFLGINAEYETTLLNELSDSPTQNTYVSTSQTWFDFGVKFRRFFGMSSNATSFTVGLRYINYQMSVPESSVSRAKLTLSGPELGLDLSTPAGHNSFWTFGLLLQPLDSLAESSGSSIRAGTSNQTIGVGGEIGAEYRLSRGACAFMKFSSLLYKTDFSGSATTSDPVTGGIPSSVPVTNIFYFLNLGIRLGH